MNFLQRLMRVDPEFQRHAAMMALETKGTTRVGTRNDTARMTNSTRWTNYKAGDRAVHHLRVIAPHEMVFDLGDMVDGQPLPWSRCVLETHALWIALNRMGIPYLGAPSGGKGTHTHVFGLPGSNPAAETAAHSRRGRFPVPENPPEPKEALAASPPCIQRIFKALQAGKNVSHTGRFTIASYFLNAGLPKSEVAGLFVRTPNYNQHKTEGQVDHISQGSYLPFGCQKLQAEGICEDHIKIHRCYRVTNPASFLLKPERIGNNGHSVEREPEVDAGPQDWRNAASGAILDVAEAVLRRMTGNPYSSIHADYRLLAPAKDSRLCREFGRKKGPGARYRKVLWTVGPGPFAPLPADRDDAYVLAEMRASVYPQSVPHSDLRSRFDRTEARLAGIKCPVGPKCILGHPANTGKNPDGCEECPLRKPL